MKPDCKCKCICCVLFFVGAGAFPKALLKRDQATASHLGCQCPFLRSREGSQLADTQEMPTWMATRMRLDTGLCVCGRYDSSAGFECKAVKTTT